MDIPILFEDEVLLAVQKPAGIHVHPSKLAQQDKTTLLELLKEQTGHCLHPAHRLDRATQGLLLFCKSKEALIQVRAQFEAGKVEKRYIALVRGWPQVEEGRVEGEIKVKKETKRKHAETQFQCLAKIKVPFALSGFFEQHYSLLRLKPKTGRRHQLRLHSKKIAGPILGDTTYGDNKQNRLFAAETGMKELCLWSAELKFQHPYTGTSLKLESPVGGSLLLLLKTLKLVAALNKPAPLSWDILE